MKVIFSDNKTYEGKNATEVIRKIHESSIVLRDQTHKEYKDGCAKRLWVLYHIPIPTFSDLLFLFVWAMTPDIKHISFN